MAVVGLVIATLVSNALGGGRMFCCGGSDFTVDWQKISKLYRSLDTYDCSEN